MKPGGFERAHVVLKDRDVFRCILYTFFFFFSRLAVSETHPIASNLIRSRIRTVCGSLDRLRHHLWLSDMHVGSVLPAQKCHRHGCRG